MIRAAFQVLKVANVATFGDARVVAATFSGKTERFQTIADPISRSQNTLLGTSVTPH